jgi:hypothetical protein
MTRIGAPVMKKLSISSSLFMVCIAAVEDKLKVQLHRPVAYYHDQLFRSPLPHHSGRTDWKSVSGL